MRTFQAVEIEKFHESDYLKIMPYLAGEGHEKQWEIAEKSDLGLSQVRGCFQQLQRLGLGKIHPGVEDEPEICLNSSGKSLWNLLFGDPQSLAKEAESLSSEVIENAIAYLERISGDSHRIEREKRINLIKEIQGVHQKPEVAISKQTEGITDSGIDSELSWNNNEGNGRSPIPEYEEISALGIEETVSSANGDRREDSPAREELLVPREEILDEDERSAELHRLEVKVERGLYSAWAALKEIRDRRLHLPQKWDEYCKARFGFSRKSAGWIIHAAEVYPVLEASPRIERGHLPKNVYALRPLRDESLNEEQWEEIWYQASEDLPDFAAPTKKVVQDIVDKVKGKVKHPPGFTEGDCLIIGRPIKYSGCWGIVLEVGSFTVTVDTWDGPVLIEEPDKAKRIDSPQEQRSIGAIWSRCRTLRECTDLDRSAYYLLEGIGKQTYLTELEDELLSFLEKKYL